MTCRRAVRVSQELDADGAPASHSAELVRGDLRTARQGPLIRPFGPPSPQGEKGLRRSHWRFTDISAALLVASSLALRAIAAAACPAASDGFVRLSSPEAEIAYRWQPDKIEVGRFFEAEVVACRVPGAGAVSRIVIDAQMPAHGHGMNYRPKATQLASGRFRFTGLMLHMAGQWQLTFDIFQGETRTRLSRALDLEP